MEFVWRAKLLSCSLAVSCSERAFMFGLPRASQSKSPEKRESNSSGILQLQNEELGSPGVVLLSSLWSELCLPRLEEYCCWQPERA